MAQAFRANRRNRAMNESLSSAFNLGSQPQQQRNNAIVVPTQDRKRYTLVTKDGSPTEAGKYWYNELNNVPVPTVYFRARINRLRFGRLTPLKFTSETF